MKILFFIPFLLLIGCKSCEKSNFPDKFYDIQVDNKSDDTIKVYLAMETEFEFPDTLIESVQPIAGFRSIAPRGSTYFDSRVKLQELFEKYLPTDTLSIFVFNTDTLERYEWQQIRTDYKILKRYDLSLQDLEKLNFKVPYPPSAEMSGMKMYP